MKIAIIGAGSAIFSKKIITDIFNHEDLRECIISLMDIDQAKLKRTYYLAKRIIKDNNLPAILEKTTNLNKALDGSKFVIIMIDTAGLEAIRYDNLIPKEYGIDQCIGDTLGPGGVFKALRLIPQVIQICKKAEALCPDALVINYSNPMAMITWAIGETTKIKHVGICHGIQETIRRLSSFLEIPENEVDYWIAGINHMAWVLKFEYKGEDLYPKILEKLKVSKEKFKNNEGVLEMFDEKYRIEMMKATGYFMTETSGHLSEYLPYFRKRSDLLKKFDGNRKKSGGWDGSSMYYFKTRSRVQKDNERQIIDMLNSKEQIALGKKSLEYAPDIIHAIVTNRHFRFNGNVKNTGLIANLPQNCCVEVPCFADRLGIHPCYVGDLPPQCAALNRTNINVQELAVKAALTGSRELAYQAVLMDPLTGAVLAPHEIRKMVNEMFKAERKWLPQFNFIQ